MNDDLELPAIKDSELRPILDRFKLSDSIDNNREHCVSCNKLISWENIGALLVKDKSLVIYCDRPECIEVVSKVRK